MHLDVLGCHGGELHGCRSTCFLVDGVLAVDAGALTSTLMLDALSRVDAVLLTHSHFDHIKDLPLLADLIVERRTSPVDIYCSSACTDTLKAHLFNDRIWPDFSVIPSAEKPVFRFKSFTPGDTFQIGKYQVQSVKVDHPVESCGFVVRDGQSAFAISGDTGPTVDWWKLVNQQKSLGPVLVETSFPNAHQSLADISGHLTPQTLEAELKKLTRPNAQVVLYHLKPAFVRELKAEVAHLPVRVLELGDRFDF